MIPPFSCGLRALAWLPLAIACLVLASAAQAEDRIAVPTTEDDAAALRSALEQDRARLLELIRRPAGGESQPLADDPELRAIAARMPRIQAALREGPSPTTAETP